MVTLVSPGTSISVIDQSINVGAGPGTVPLIFIATQENKAVPDGAAIAEGTTKANAGKIWSITSQRDLVQTFGDPVFYEISGTSINGYPLNEYGLLAAYSYMGISNLARIVRCDIDTAQLEPTPIEPTSPASVGTYWLDESASTFGLFQRQGTGVSEAWVPTEIDFVYNFLTGTTNTPPALEGVQGDHAVVFQTVSGEISYWVKGVAAWLQLAGTTGTESILIQSVWPDLLSTTEEYWVKTGSAAQGANIVLRRMDATLAQFVQVEAPILIDNAAADSYYSSNPNGSLGQIYIQPTAGDSLVFRLNSNGTWAALAVIIGQADAPTQGPSCGQLWYNALVGVDNEGLSTIDILVADGAGAWQNINLPGYSTLTVTPGQPTLYTQSAEDQKP